MERVKPWLRNQGDKEKTCQSFNGSGTWPQVGTRTSWEETAGTHSSSGRNHCRAGKARGSGEGLGQWRGAGAVVVAVWSWQSSSNVGLLQGESSGRDHGRQPHHAAARRGVVGRQQVAVSEEG